jgi:hypothetical protein
MKPSLEKACVPRHVKLAALWLALGLPLYILSIGPVAWAVNDGAHRAYLPERIMVIYMPLVPLMRIECVNDALCYYTAVIWHGFPYGYTTL